MSADLDMTKSENLIHHIDGLQVALAKRNARIAELEQRLTEEGESEAIRRAEQKAYRRGWEACASRLMDATRDCVLALGDHRRASLDVYYEPERAERSARAVDDGTTTPG